MEKKKRQTMESNDEFMEYLRRNFYKGYSKGFNIFEEQNKEIIKIAKVLKKEIQISDIRKIFLGTEG